MRLDRFKILRIGGRVSGTVRVYDIREELLVSAITTGWFSRKLTSTRCMSRSVVCAFFHCSGIGDPEKSERFWQSIHDCEA